MKHHAKKKKKQFFCTFKSITVISPVFPCGLLRVSLYRKRANEFMQYLKVILNVKYIKKQLVVFEMRVNITCERLTSK